MGRCMGGRRLGLTMLPGCNTWSKAGQRGATRRPSSSCDENWYGIGWCLLETRGLLPRDTRHKTASQAPTHLDGGKCSAQLQILGTRHVIVSIRANAHLTRTIQHSYTSAATACTQCSASAITLNNTAVENHSQKPNGAGCVYQLTPPLNSPPSRQHPPTLVPAPRL